jgi:hypothetical protein
MNRFDLVYLAFMTSTVGFCLTMLAASLIINWRL